MYTLGVDIGSTTSKCVIMNDGSDIVATSLEIGGMGTSGPEDSVREVLDSAGLNRDDIARTIATGYGRMKYEDADGEVSELTCHALGASHIFQGLRTVIDIGGQDAKIISLSSDGRMTNFVMNDKCAAGTGRFLDVMANIQEVKVSYQAALGAKSTKRVAISSTCTVFAESEVISQLSKGTDKDDIIAGIHRSVASRVIGLANRVGVVKDVVMTGGVAQNYGVREALEEGLGVEIKTSPLAQYNGALGAALYAYKKAVK